MKREPARVLALLAAFGIGVAIAATPSPMSEASSTAPPGLTAVTRLLTQEATAAPAFNRVVGERGIPIVTVFREVRFPKGYRAYHVHDPEIARDFTVVLTPHRDSFVVYPASPYFVGWEPGHQRMARIEQYLVPALQGYEKRDLRNAVLYSAARKPTVELLATQGSPSETAHASYIIWMLIFPPGVTVLTLNSPCDWWIATPPPEWRAMSAHACEPKWIEVPHT